MDRFHGVLHVAWSEGLVAFAWHQRALDRKAVSSLVTALFGNDEEDRFVEDTVSLMVPGRARPTEVAAVRVPIEVAAEAFERRSWVPWTSLGASLAWCASVARFASGLADQRLLVPSLRPVDAGWLARWEPVTDDEAGRAMAVLAASMPPVVGALAGPAAPWQLTAAMVEAFADDVARRRLVDVPAATVLGRGRQAEIVLARRFVAALATPSGSVLTATPAEHEAARRLSAHVGRWARPLTGRSPFADVTVSARVVPPDAIEVERAAGDDHLDPQDLPWLVELGCAPADDPSLVVPAVEVWSGAAPPGLDVAVARDALRLALRRIGAAAPTLAAALDSGRPGNAALTLPELVQFLEAEAEPLQQGGFPVLLPAWWGQRSRTAVRGRATPQAAVTSAGLEARSLAHVDWRLVVGDEHLDEAELERVAQAKAPLVFLRGRWVALDPDQVQRAIGALTARRQDTPALTPLELLRLGADPDDEVEVEGTGWAAELLAGLPDDRLEPLPEPAGFHGTLRPYQRRGLGWLAFLARLGLGGCLADDMGLGKTAQLLALLAHEHAEGRGGRVLVVCPLSVVRNWETEAARFTPDLRVLVHHGPQRARGDALVTAAGDADLVVSTYATVTRDVEALAAMSWHRIVADEAQHVKNSSTATARALRRIPAGQKLALTGTPVENRLSELWSVLDLVNPGLLGSAKRFRERFAVPIERHRDHDATEQLRRLAQPFLLRRSKADPALVPELPPKIEQVAWAHLTREQAGLYRSVVDVLLQRLDDLEGIERRGAILAAITKLKQVCNHPAQYLADRSRLEARSGKLTVFDELVDDALDADASVLVFTQYRVMGELLAAHLNHRLGPMLGSTVPFLHGGVSKAGRDRMVDRFQDGSGGPLLLVSLKAGGSGLNLTAASHVVHYDRWWNPAVEDQASDRAWRIGQTSTVVVHKLVCLGTIEERIDALIAEKKDLAQRVVGAGEAWLTELSTAELRDLLVLREAT